MTLFLWSIIAKADMTTMIATITAAAIITSIAGIEKFEIGETDGVDAGVEVRAGVLVDVTAGVGVGVIVGVVLIIASIR